MTHILMYKTPICPYCKHAKELLSRKGITEIEEIDISKDSSKLSEMMEKSGGRRTVPQIFIAGQHVGGFDDLSALDQDGKLDDMLK